MEFTVPQIHTKVAANEFGMPQ